MTSGSTAKATHAAFAVSASGAAVALGAASWSGSSAMLSAAIVALAATSSQALMLYGARRAGQALTSTSAAAATDMHFWSTVAAMVPFATGAGAAIRDGVVALLDQQPVAEAPFALLSLAAVFAISTASLWRASGGFSGAQPRSPAAAVSITLAIEHAAVLGASLLAAAGIAASHGLGWIWADGAAAAAIGLLLASVAAFLALELRKVLDDGAAVIDQVADSGEGTAEGTDAIGPPAATGESPETAITQRETYIEPPLEIPVETATAPPSAPPTARADRASKSKRKQRRRGR